MKAKKIVTYIGCFIALALVGRMIYVRVTPSPEAQKLNNAAQEIDRKLDELEKK